MSRTELPLPIACAPTALLLLALLLPPFPGRRLVFLPIAILTIYTPLRFTTGSPGGDFGLATQVYLIALAWDRLTSNEGEFRRRGRKEKGMGAKRSNGGVVPRLGWALQLMGSMRGADWSWEVKNTPSATIRNRIPFLLDRSVRILLDYLALDVLSTYFMHSHRYFTRQITFDQLRLHEKALCSLAGAVAGATAISLLYSVVCFVGVASFVYSPAECPDLFGPLEPTLAGFWGKTWHQSFRRTFGGIGNAVSKLLRLTPRSTLHRLVTTAVAFACSGFQHGFAVHCMQLRRGWGTFVFFMLQPVGIMVESVVYRWLGNKGNSPGRALMGYLWACGWLLATFSLFLDEMVVGGMWEVNLTPYSIVQGGRWVD